MPELELGETADEGAELLVVLVWEAGACVAVFKAFVLCEGGVEFRG